MIESSTNNIQGDQKIVRRISENRQDFLDIARGLAIVLVVFGHALRGLAEAGTFEFAGVWGAVDYLIYTFHMPIFFLISGSLMVKTFGQPLPDFFKSRIINIAWPYVLWSLIQGTIVIVLSGSGATNFHASPAMLLTIGWAPFSQFWFLYALFFASILLILCMRYFSVAATLAIAVIFFFLAEYLLPLTLRHVAYGFLYLALGAFATDKNGFSALRPKYLDCMIFLIAGLAIGLLFLFMEVQVRQTIPAACAMMAALLCVSKAIAEKPNYLSICFRFLGQFSFGIFILHLIAIGVTRLVAQRVLGISEPAILLALLTIAGTLLPLVAQAIVLKLGIATVAGLPLSAFKPKIGNLNGGNRHDS